MGIDCFLINSLYLLGTCGKGIGFKRDIASFKEKQREILLSIIRQNRDTDFGKRHRFSEIHDIESFQKNVPVRTYEEFQEDIQRMTDGEKNVLTSQEVMLFEPTGGTTSGSKLIPYTQRLKKEFQEAVNPWLYRIYSRYPRLLRGKSYWSVTPSVTEGRYTKGGTPIGFEDDSQYLGLLGKILRHVLVVPKEIRRIKEIDNSRYATAYFLLKERRLALISVWNPTFLLLLLETLEKHLPSLLHDIAHGTLSLPIPEPEPAQIPSVYLKADPKRATQIETLVTTQNAQQRRPIDYPAIWPHLAFISCWTSGFANHYLGRIRDIFPGVVLQGKGLIATEGIVTIPYFFPQDKGDCPAYLSHFLEFMEEENDSPLKLLHQLEKGKTYTVVITTSGGLYRYNLKDRVKVTGTYRNMPLLTFEGRDSVCDIVGEKLSVGHVQTAIQNLLDTHRLNPGFVMMAPHLEETSCYYTLFIDSLDNTPPQLLKTLRHELEEHLCRNFHYRYARDLGQIKPLKLFLVRSNALNTYFKRCVEGGQKMGDIKPIVLDKRPGWHCFFDGNFVEP